MSLFGAQPSGFGAPATNTLGQSTNTSGLFGQPNQSQGQNQPQSNTFGASLLGTSTLAQPQPQSNPLGGGILGGSTLGGNTLGGNTLGGNTLGGNVLGGSTLGGSLLGQPQMQQQPQQQSAAPGFMNASQAPAQRSSLIWEPGRESLSKFPFSLIRP